MKYLHNIEKFYATYDKAVKENDKQQLKYLAQFTTMPEDYPNQTFRRRQICENMASNTQWITAGYRGIPLNDYGWHECNFPFDKQEITKLGESINRGCCNMVEKMLIGILQLPNNKWVAEVQKDFSNIGENHCFIGIWKDQYETRKEAWNTTLMKFIRKWRNTNKGISKEDQAVREAKRLLIVDGDFIENTPLPKGEIIQLSLF